MVGQEAASAVAQVFEEQHLQLGGSGLGEWLTASDCGFKFRGYGLRSVNGLGFEAGGPMPRTHN